MLSSTTGATTRSVRVTSISNGSTPSTGYIAGGPKRAISLEAGGTPDPMTPCSSTQPVVLGVSLSDAATNAGTPRPKPEGTTTAPSGFSEGQTILSERLNWPPEADSGAWYSISVSPRLRPRGRRWLRRVSPVTTTVACSHLANWLAGRGGYYRSTAADSGRASNRPAIDSTSPVRGSTQSTPSPASGSGRLRRMSRDTLASTPQGPSSRAPTGACGDSPGDQEEC